ncbi:MAG: ABC transporter ATP-binding protein [Rhodothermales bacterium]|nr:ABC transporter ATP-binding protein [Rhodothermales bacterium]
MSPAPHTGVEPPRGGIPTAETPAVVADGLSKTYSTRFGRRRIEALGPTDLDVRRGEVFGILGPNGAGKTTLLKLLLGIVRPTTGSGRILGQPINDASTRERVGYLPENHRFPPHLTGRQVLDIYGRLGGMTGGAIDAAAPALLERVELAAWADARVGTYSKGMMQRLGIAQALLSGPDLLILDEPTDGVDPVGRRAIRGLLSELRLLGTSVLLNSHILSEVEQICDRVAILRGGKILRTGTVEEISSPGRIVRIGYRSAGDDTVQVRTITDASTDAINSAIDGFRAERSDILYVEREKRTLEAGFLELLDAPEAGPSDRTEAPSTDVPDDSAREEES